MKEPLEVYLQDEVPQLLRRERRPHLVSEELRREHGAVPHLLVTTPRPPLGPSGLFGRLEAWVSSGRGDVWSGRGWVGVRTLGTVPVSGCLSSPSGSTHTNISFFTIARRRAPWALPSTRCRHPRHTWSSYQRARSRSKTGPGSLLPSRGPAPPGSGERGPSGVCPNRPPVLGLHWRERVLRGRYR